MNILGAKLYDPAVAVSKATSALLAMTAFDTTNLRLAITVPAHGMVLFKGMVTLVGATTFPVVFLGVLNGSTVLCRVTPTDFPGTASAATQTVPCRFEAVVSGLTPGAMNVDFAYGVDVLVASTNFKYGGPNDTTTANAWGAAQFEAWDPQPMATAAQLAINSSGQVSVGSLASNVITAASIAAAALNGKGDWNIGKTGYALSAAGVQAIWDALTSALSTVGSIGKLLVDNINATISSRLATSGYTAPDNTTITAINAKTTNLPASPAAVGSAMTLTSGERTSIANEVEAQIIDETDAEKVLTAITNKIASVNPDLGGLSIAAIAAGVRSNLTTELGRIDANISSRGTGAALDAAGVRSAVGLASANLDAQLTTIDDFLDTEIVAIKSKTDNLPVNPAAATDIPTAVAVRTEIDSNSTKLDVAVSSRLAAAGYTAPDNTAIGAIKTKTDSLTFTKPGEVDVNLQSVNDIAVAGTGETGNEWRPA